MRHWKAYVVLALAVLTGPLASVVYRVTDSAVWTLLTLTVGAVGAVVLSISMLGTLPHFLRVYIRRAWVLLVPGITFPAAVCLIAVMGDGWLGITLGIAVVVAGIVLTGFLAKRTFGESPLQDPAPTERND